MPRVKSVAHAQKDQGTCLKCGDAITKGMPYRYFKRYRQRSKNLFCMKATCTPTQADLDSSKMSAVYQAQQQAHNDVDMATLFSEVEDALQALAEAAREVAGEYEEAIEAMPALEDSLREKIDALEGYADDLETLNAEGYEDDPEATDEENASTYAEALEELQDEARDAIDSLEV